MFLSFNLEMTWNPISPAIFTMMEDEEIYLASPEGTTIHEVNCRSGKYISLILIIYVYVYSEISKTFIFIEIISRYIYSG